MPRRDPSVPKHRGPAPRTALTTGLRRSALLFGVALAATGIAVSSGVVTHGQGSGGASAALASADLDATSRASRPSVGRPPVDLGDRTRQVSRSDRRTGVDATKRRALDQDSGGQVTRTEDLATEDPRTIARTLLPRFGFSSDQFACLDSLYVSESGWDVHADNASSSAYGIPQALPGSKMASAGADWAANPATQIRWGLGYIRSSYGTPCNAWSFKQGHNWY